MAVRGTAALRIDRITGLNRICRIVAVRRVLSTASEGELHDGRFLLSAAELIIVEIASHI
jgi:hypothetical protein